MSRRKLNFIKENNEINYETQKEIEIDENNNINKPSESQMKQFIQNNIILPQMKGQEPSKKNIKKAKEYTKILLNK